MPADAPPSVAELLRQVFKNPYSPEYGIWEILEPGEELLENVLYRFDVFQSSGNYRQLTVFTGIEQLGGELWEQECRVLVRIAQHGHPALPRVTMGGYRRERNFAFVMTETAESTLDEPEKLSELASSPVKALHQFALLADALALLHGQGLLHRNIVPGSVEVATTAEGATVLRLARFELSSLLANLFREALDRGNADEQERVLRLFANQGPRALACFAPERLRAIARDEAGDTVETDRSDVYALGVLAWQFFFGPLPDNVLADAFGGQLSVRGAKVLRDHMTAALNRPTLPKQLANLILSMLKDDARTRPTAHQVCSDLAMHFDSIVAPWTRFEGETAFLVGFMPEESKATIGHWGWLSHDPATDIGRLELKNLIEDDLRDARLVRSETGFHGRDHQVGDNTWLAKTVLLGRRAAWFCVPWRFGTTGELLPSLLLIKYVQRRHNAADLYAMPFSQTVPPVEAIATNIPDRVLLYHSSGRPVWTELIDASRRPAQPKNPHETFQNALEWLLEFQEVEIVAREYAYVIREVQGDRVLLLFDDERDGRRLAKHSANPLLSFFAATEGKRPKFGRFFGSEEYRLESPRLQISPDSGDAPNRSYARTVTYADEEHDLAFWVRKETDDEIPRRGWIRPEDDHGAQTTLWRQRAAWEELQTMPGLLAQLDTPTAIQGFDHHWRDAILALDDEGTHEGRPKGARARLLEMLTMQPFYALQGPPGTGKTETVARAVTAYLRRERGARVLVSAQSHYALDNLFERVERALPDDSDVVVVRIASPESVTKVAEPVRRKYLLGKATELYVDGLKNKCKENLKDRSLSPVTREVVAKWLAQLDSSHVELRERIRRGASLVFATCSGATKRAVSSGGPFAIYDWAIVEEAAKAWPTEIIIPLVRSYRWTLVGDHKQLPAHRKSDVEAFLDLCAASDNSEIAREPEMAVRYRPVFNLFGGYFDGFVQREGTRALEGTLVKPVGKLTQQRRMRDPICQVVSGAFYGGDLTSASSTERDHFIERPGFIRGQPLVWIDTDGQTGFEQRLAWHNPGEIDLLLRLLGALSPFPSVGLGDYSEEPIAIVTPYNDQRKRLISALRAAKLPGLGAPEQVVHNVHTIQGRQAEVVVASLVRTGRDGETVFSNIGYLASDSIINVLLSRARRLLVVIGDFEAFRTSGVKFWKDVCDGFEQHGRRVSAASLRPDHVDLAGGVR